MDLTDAAHRARRLDTAGGGRYDGFLVNRSTKSRRRRARTARSAAISDLTAQRLSIYLRCLDDLEKAGQRTRPPCRPPPPLLAPRAAEEGRGGAGGGGGGASALSPPPAGGGAGGGK